MLIRQTREDIYMRYKLQAFSFRCGIQNGLLLGFVALLLFMLLATYAIYPYLESPRPIPSGGPCWRTLLSSYCESSYGGIRYSFSGWQAAEAYLEIMLALSAVFIYLLSRRAAHFSRLNYFSILPSRRFLRPFSLLLLILLGNRAIAPHIASLSHASLLLAISSRMLLVVDLLVAMPHYFASLLARFSVIQFSFVPNLFLVLEPIYLYALSAILIGLLTNDSPIKASPAQAESSL